MVSILTNTAAIAALATLRDINSAMATTQTQISGGQRVASARDNAAYWSIATTMRSDNKALSAVSDTLNLSAAMVDVAYTAMNSTIGVLDQIKAKVVAASQPGVDKGKVQKEINKLQDQLTTISKSASFNGQNWLSIDASIGATVATNLVSGFTRDADGGISLQTTTVDLWKTALFNTQGNGLLETEIPTDPASYSTMSFSGTLDGLLTGAPQAPASGVPVSAFNVDEGDVISFSFNKGGTSRTVTINRAAVNSAVGSGNKGTIVDANDMAAVFNKAVQRAGISSSDLAASSTFVRRVGDVFSISTLASGASISNVKIKEAVPPPPPADPVTHPTIGIKDIDVTASSANLGDYLSQVDVMMKSVTDAAARLGALQAQLTAQTKFTDTLMDTLEKGIGTLVDTDMNEASTRLKAQQTQQQLSIQALSIANSGADTILQLFR
ncbi:flagellin [Rhizobium oryzicola]|uniref:Flagellin n=1 Tax=Rhizobium oryzicola TaxID=1232668 RepID=A0ABT8SS55_9HYPH|nr:flagellin [Rhizobium oryzicola]MDO1581216.1 flagellin [Rhizobium oryzicola]